LTTKNAELPGFDPKQAMVRRPRSPLYDAWIILLQNKVAVSGGIFLILLVLAAIFAPFIAPQGIDEQNLPDNYKQPSFIDPTSPYLLGADRFGRDVLTRVIFGARVSLSVAFAASAVSLSIGLIYGLVSGFFGGSVDNVMMRVVDILYAFPS
jgi:ABC-type dipeptide/oligopeptide/nickel transport system permease subunit